MPLINTKNLAVLVLAPSPWLRCRTRHTGESTWPRWHYSIGLLTWLQGLASPRSRLLFLTNAMRELSTELCHAVDCLFRATALLMARHKGKAA